KTAIVGMTRAVAIETTAAGITCNAIAPGALPTPAILGKIASIAADQDRSIEATTRDYLAARQPTGKFVAMEGVGAMVVFLCSTAAGDITAAVLPIDGGWSIT
ncbi:MAG TPA: SDR family oxidoreductase, partial [Bradyrhizobium sp.]|nr:SDR family oxidoreductase [Bradyrhizobium sp.]